MNTDIEVGFLFFENLGRNERLDECPDVSKEAKASIEKCFIKSCKRCIRDVYDLEAT